MILKIIVKETKTINQIVQEKFQFSNNLFNKLIRNKNIFLNKLPTDTRITPKLGDEILIDLNYYEDNTNIVPTKMNLNIMYQDDGLLIINKPAGIAVHPSILHYQDSLSNGIKYYFDSINLHKKIRPVNRLDFDTSGIIIFAKNEYIQENLIRQMIKGTFYKEYLAIISGHLENSKGIINAPIARKEGSIIERCVNSNGQNAITEYEVIKEKNNMSLIKCHLLTGRTHQIRVHFSYIGHPLIGDTLYGNSQANQLNIKRQALHSSKVSFLHPITNKPFELSSDLPVDLNFYI